MNKNKGDIAVKSFLNGKVYYDSYGQYFFIQRPTGGVQMLAQLRGYGAIRNLFDTDNDASKFQDEVGKWISDAINEKIQREQK